MIRFVEKSFRDAARAKAEAEYAIQVFGAMESRAEAVISQTDRGLRIGDVSWNTEEDVFTVLVVEE